MKTPEFDSDEEMYFYWWLLELKELGYVTKIEHQPESFELSVPLKMDYLEEMKTKSKYVTEELMKRHIYTTDFYVEWNPDKLNQVSTLINSDIRKKKGQSLNILLCDSEKGICYSFIEVKPIYDMNNMTRLAKINQKWVWQECGEYINIVIPEKHFNKTFTPGRYLLTNKRMMPRKIDPKKIKNVRSSSEFLGCKKYVYRQQPLF